jgi:hypothetical protein
LASRLLDKEVEGDAFDIGTKILAADAAAPACGQKALTLGQVRAQQCDP